MSIDKKKSIVKKMFPKGSRMVWAPTDEVAKREFAELLTLREEYRKAGGMFKKK
jgi:hypothetical protein